jgi:N-acetylmuramic acid 6-phosphate etherase
MLKTEMRNPNTMHFDRMSSAEQVAAMCRENQNAVLAVEKAAPEIAKAIDAVAQAFQNGHRLFFIGAGTSGRLGVLDAAECPPTFGVSHDTVQGIIAGGKERMFTASENDEDKLENGVADIRNSGLGAGDVLVGVSVAGGAAYVVGALNTARDLGATTVALTSNFDTPIEKCADITIITDTGADVLTGSTRLKAGTAHKMVMNMLTTCGMAQTGKVYENMMINLKPSNIKLRNRVVRITREILQCDEETAIAALEANEWNIRRAVESK